PRADLGRPAQQGRGGVDVGQVREAELAPGLDVPLVRLRRRGDDGGGQLGRRDGGGAHREGAHHGRDGGEEGDEGDDDSPPPSPYHPIHPFRLARRRRFSWSRVDAKWVAGRTLARKRGVMLTIAWIAVGVVLIGVEVHHLAFYALFGAVGCFAAAIVSAVAPDAIALQVIAAVVVAVLGIVLLRPAVSAAVTQRRGGVRTTGVHGGLVGQEVVTLDTVGGHGEVGHVRLAGERWRAVSGNDQPIPVGT